MRFWRQPRWVGALRVARRGRRLGLVVLVVQEAAGTAGQQQQGWGWWWGWWAACLLGCLLAFTKTNNKPCCFYRS